MNRKCWEISTVGWEFIAHLISFCRRRDCRYLDRVVLLVAILLVLVGLADLMDLVLIGDDREAVDHHAIAVDLLVHLVAVRDNLDDLAVGLSAYPSF